VRRQPQAAEPRKYPTPEVAIEPRIIRGLSLDAASRVVAAKAAEQLQLNPGAEVGVWTEQGNSSVLVGIARRGKATSTTLIPKAEYDGLKLLELLEASCAG
jgi:hypothetical protein